MVQILISFLIGAAAALIDTVPMIMKKLDSMFIASAFSFWMVAAFFIPRLQIVQSAWINGILVSLIMLVPLIILVIRLDPKAVKLVMGTTVLLGAAVGFISEIVLKRFS